MSRIQLQPHLDRPDEWVAFAQAQGLSFEPLLLLPLSEDGYQRLAQTGLVTSLHGAFIGNDPASGDAQIRAISRTRCEESCLLAHKLGADTVVFHSSCFPFLRGAYLEQWANICGEYYSALAEKYRLSLLIENAADVDPTPLSELMQHCSSQVAVCLDVGHANYSRLAPEHWFEALGDNIRCLHLSDNYGSFDDHLPLGEGTVDWKKVDFLVRQIGTVERMTLEVGNLDGVKTSITFLRQNHLFGME